MKKNIGSKIGALTLACVLSLGTIPLQAYADHTPEKNAVKIGLLSDTHYFSQSLYSDCPDFTTALNSDRKMLKESDAILTSALHDLIQDAPDFVLVSGDLTKDGEQINHEAFANKLVEAKKELASKGVDTNFYVINGNHDINNPNGKDFSSGHAVDADRTTVEEFKEIYQDFGYGKDSVQYSPEGNRGGSLSYVTRPEEGYTLISVDSGKYSSDQTASGKDLQETGGVIGADLLHWVTQQAKQAKQRGDIVMVMQHHGVIPHFDMEPTVMADYLVDNWQEVEQAYADAGVSYVFTGHMHANDIASYTSPKGNVLYDIETGSLLTYPSRMREAEIVPGSFDTDKSSTIRVETKMPSVVHYTDFDTGELNDIVDITAYGKQHTLSNEVIKTMLSEDLLKPLFKDTLENGGTKELIGNLLGITDTAQVSPAIANIVTGLLPTDKANGLNLTVAGFTFSIYYDPETEQVKISQITETTVQTDNVLELALDNGNTVTVTIPEELGVKLQSQIETFVASQPAEVMDVETRGLLDPIELFVRKDSVINFLDTTFTNVDQEFLAQPDRISHVVDTLLDQVLNAGIDDTHTVFDLVNYSYQTHLAGSEVCESWAENVLEKLKDGPILHDILIDAIKNTQPALKDALSALPIDLGTIIEKGNNGLATGIAFSTITGMFSNAGDIIDMVDLSSLLPSSLLDKVNNLAYDVAYSMTHDDNIADDNKGTVEITRTLDETIFDAKAALENASKIEQGNYTDASYQDLKEAMQHLEAASAQDNREEIKNAIYTLNQAVAALIVTPTTPEIEKPSEAPVPTEKPDETFTPTETPNVKPSEKPVTSQPSAAEPTTTENTVPAHNASAKAPATGDTSWFGMQIMLLLVLVSGSAMMAILHQKQTKHHHNV